MKIDYQQIPQALRRISFRTFIVYALFGLLFLLVSMLILDVLIFLRYYRIATQLPQATLFEQSVVSRQDLERVLDIIKIREVSE